MRKSRKKSMKLLRRNLFRLKRRRKMWRDHLRVDLIKFSRICRIMINHHQVANSSQPSLILINLKPKTNNLTSTLTRNKLNKINQLLSSILMTLSLELMYKHKINKNNSSLLVKTYLVSSQLFQIKYNNPYDSSNTLIHFQRIIVNSQLNSSNNKFSQSKLNISNISN